MQQCKVMCCAAGTVQNLCCQPHNFRPMMWPAGLLSGLGTQNFCSSVIGEKGRALINQLLKGTSLLPLPSGGRREGASPSPCLRPPQKLESSFLPTTFPPPRKSKGIKLNFFRLLLLLLLARSSTGPSVRIILPSFSLERDSVRRVQLRA